MRTRYSAPVVGLAAFAISLSALAWTGSTGPTAGADLAGIHQMAIMTPDGTGMNMDMDGSGATHDHPLREVAADAVAPSVTHLAFPDAMDGYNIQILTQNFTFAPASINGAVVENEGHAHLYVNGEKITRVYGGWVHLPSDALVPGANAVSITLNANDHSEWAVDGAPIASTVIIRLPTSEAS